MAAAFPHGPAGVWSLFHKTLRIRKLRIYSYGQILTVNLLLFSKFSEYTYSKMAVNYV